ncbi:MAG: hypothetical protein AB1633_04555 [Elusimicrobiota bacterium]
MINTGFRIKDLGFRKRLCDLVFTGGPNRCFINHLIAPPLAGLIAIFLTNPYTLTPKSCLYAQEQAAQPSATVQEETTQKQTPPAVSKEAAPETPAEQEKKEATVSKKPAKEIFITDVGSDESDGKKMYYIVINDLIKIAEIEATKIAGKTIIKYPVYVSKRSGRAYPQVKVISKQANDAITKAIETLKPSKAAGSMKDIDFRIAVFNPSRSASRKVNVEVAFADAVQISCGIMETGAEPWVAWPSRKDEQTGQYIQQIFFKGTIKKKVEEAVLKKYQVYKTEGDTEEWK